MSVHLMLLYVLAWAQFAISLFNCVLLIWLGLTVLLNAQQRSWGNTLAGCGLLLGSAFFLAHTAALDFSLDTIFEDSARWWMVLAIPLLCLPFGWLILMLWSCGYWDEKTSILRHRARYALTILSAFLVLLCALGFYSAPHLGQSPFGALENYNEATFMGTRALLLLYPIFLVLCIATSLWALMHPIPSGRMMTEEARRRARPYLFASTLVQLLASLSMAFGMAFFGYLSLYSSLYDISGHFNRWLDVADAGIEFFIAIAVMLLGKAIVSFEIFTGKILPRRGFWRQWRAIVTIAAIYASLVAFSLGFELRLVVSLLITTSLMSAFLAVFSHRAYADRERALANLTPFVASQHLTRGLLSGQTSPFQNALEEPFRALCEDVLGASRAVLMARGAHADLAGAPKIYPSFLPFDEQWGELLATWQPDSHSRDAIALPDGRNMNYLVPLGSATEPLGALLLGPKRDGTLYTIEEMEIGRAVGEHLLDSSAAATLAARLVELQRQKLAQVHVLDRGARRVLHDDILPLLHGALLNLSAKSGVENEIEAISSAHRAISNLLREAPISSSPLSHRDFWAALQHEIEVEQSGAFDAVSLEIAPAARDFALQLPPVVAETLFFAAREAVRNAAKYGRGKNVERSLSLCVEAHLDEAFSLELCDDGAGLSENRALAPQSGSGNGLALHATLLAIAGGDLRMENGESGGTRVVLQLPRN